MKKVTPKRLAYEFKDVQYKLCTRDIKCAAMTTLEYSFQSTYM